MAYRLVLFLFYQLPTQTPHPPFSPKGGLKNGSTEVKGLLRHILAALRYSTVPLTSVVFGLHSPCGKGKEAIKITSYPSPIGQFTPKNAEKRAALLKKAIKGLRPTGAVLSGVCRCCWLLMNQEREAGQGRLCRGWRFSPVSVPVKILPRTLYRVERNPVLRSGCISMRLLLPTGEGGGMGAAPPIKV